MLKVLNYKEAGTKKPALIGYLGIRDMLRTSILRGRELRRIAEAEAAELELALNQNTNLEDNQTKLSQFPKVLEMSMKSDKLIRDEPNDHSFVSFSSRKSRNDSMRDFVEEGSKA